MGLELGTFRFYLLKYIGNFRKIRKGGYVCFLYIHSFYLNIQKRRRRKKCSLHNYHSVLLLIHFQIFDFNINIQFYYLLYIVISFFLFFPPQCRNIEQLYILLFRNSKNRITSSQCLKLLHKLYPTYKAKRNKEKIILIELFNF